MKPTAPPTTTSSTRSNAEAIGLTCCMLGTSSTMIAVIGSTLKLALKAAMKASGAIATASTASSDHSLSCGIRIASAPP